MTAAAAEAQITDVDVANGVISRTVRALRSGHGTDVRVIASKLGMSRGSFYNRLNGASVFSGGELVFLAAFFGVSVQEICDGIVRIDPSAAASNMSRSSTRSHLTLIECEQVAGVNAPDAASAKHAYADVDRTPVEQIAQVA